MILIQLTVMDLYRRRILSLSEAETVRQIINPLTPAVLPLSQKECNSHFLRSQTISSLTKFIQKLLTFMSPNRVSMEILHN